MTIDVRFFESCPLDRTDLRRLLNFVFSQDDIDATFTYTRKYFKDDSSSEKVISFLNTINIHSDKDLIDILGKSFWQYELNEPNSLNAKNNRLM